MADIDAPFQSVEQLEDAFEEYIDKHYGPVKIGNQTLAPSEILKTIEPDGEAYRDELDEFAEQYGVDLEELENIQGVKAPTRLEDDDPEI